MSAIIKADDKNAAKIAAQFLKKGSLIIYPTETSYGIGVDIGNKKSLEKIYKIKQRPIEKQLIYLVSTIAMAKKYAIITKDHEKLIRKFMPGPLTIVAKRKESKIISTDSESTQSVSAGTEFAFRISSNKLANSIVKTLGRAIVSTSANLTGDPPLYKIRDVMKHFQDLVPLIIDACDLPIQKPSTVIDLFNGINIRREGPITKKQIKMTLNS
ncbi:MAG: threonylcarbamoyl-AMP synthase [Candidatus Aenigmarchaeota archaeon]|nr:threonylcarbamoyl-AMP synthase [Candidatus Aenigmarchaeota archaeon]